MKLLFPILISAAVGLIVFGVLKVKNNHLNRNDKIGVAFCVGFTFIYASVGVLAGKGLKHSDGTWPHILKRHDEL